MPDVVGVSFKKTCKVYYFDPGELSVKAGDSVVVETVRGQEMGTVVYDIREVDAITLKSPLKMIVRLASARDKEQLLENEAKEQEALEVCEAKIAQHNLDMKLVDVEFTFDRSKLIFLFTADDRVDFRNLVKELAGIFKTRIELRQIGVRDEAKIIGGIGLCGQPLCCSRFLQDFDPVSIRMAKAQDLPLNPSKISGACGRLMCCLRYEHEVYKEFNDKAPKRNTTVKTSFGPGRVVDYNVVKQKVIIELEDSTRKEVAVDDIRRKKKKLSE